ncbi:MAG: hypothetical protein KGI27_05085 [Thaumarchaeota archaeon]|nr:hypothetical protein [Nitrososphaerota archaeon]
MKSIIKPTIITSFLVFLLFAPLVKAEADDTSGLVPSWIKHDALWWAQGKISDVDFINGMRWLVENRILPVADLMEETESQLTPDSIKNIAYYWTQDRIPDSAFLGGIQYLISNGVIELNENLTSKIIKEELGQVSVWNDAKKPVVIVPVFTATAYSKHGFYSYYLGKCDSTCLSATIYARGPLGYSASEFAVDVLRSLGYHTITDIDVDKNPGILSQYDKVIVLHNEYVTQKEFDAIISHPHVIYLYPNSLYAKIIVNYDQNTITLLRGHGYPEPNISNGFGWKFDNSQFEYDTSCSNWKFNEIKNGIMLDCYPENHLAYNIPLLKAIKDY